MLYVLLPRSLSLRSAQIQAKRSYNCNWTKWKTNRAIPSLQCFARLTFHILYCAFLLYCRPTRGTLLHFQSDVLQIFLLSLNDQLTSSRNSEFMSSVWRVASNIRARGVLPFELAWNKSFEDSVPMDLLCFCEYSWNRSNLSSFWPHPGFRRFRDFTYSCSRYFLI